MKIGFIKHNLFILFFITITASSFAKNADYLKIHDISKIYHSRVLSVIDVKSVKDIKEALNLANKNGLKISIAGKQHSQGGQTLLRDSIHLNMLTFNKILDFNNKQKTITVQSGVTWRQIQDFINPYNLSVQIMQSSNIFTIGGSVSVNAHGRDPKYGPMIESIKSFHILLANGSLTEVSRTKNKDLFKLVIGGYGLFGIITDITLNLTDNHLLK